MAPEAASWIGNQKVTYPTEGWAFPGIVESPERVYAVSGRPHGPDAKSGSRSRFGRGPDFSVLQVGQRGITPSSTSIATQRSQGPQRQVRICLRGAMGPPFRGSLSNTRAS